MLRELTIDELGFVAGGQTSSPRPQPSGPSAPPSPGTIDVGGGVSIGGSISGGFPPTGGMGTVTITFGSGSSGGGSSGGTDYGSEADRLRDQNDRDSGRSASSPSD